MADWHFIEVDRAYHARERKKAQELKRSQWWKNILGKGICHFCGQKFSPKELTMDHLVPIARGGASTRGNVVPSCKKCNTNKKLSTPAELALGEINEKKDSKS